LVEVSVVAKLKRDVVGRAIDPAGSPSGGRGRVSRTTLEVAKPTSTKRRKTTVEQQRQYVGIDLHRRRSVIVRRTPEGETLDTVRIENDALALAAELAKAGEHPEVVLEATYGWYWAADVLAECGANVHLAHPLGNNWGHRRVKKRRARRD